MGVWIESDVDLADHPKTLHFMDLLQIDTQQAIGALHCLWHFTMKYAWRDGDLSRYGVSAIAKGARWAGDSEVFVKALQDAGWLDGFKIHDWLDSAGRLVNDRIYNEKRKKKSGRRSADHLRRITPLKSPITPLPNPTLPNQTIPKDKDIVPRGTFTKPSLNDLKAYCLERRNAVDPEKFIAHYDSNGWKVGRNPMKDWKAAVRTWEKSDFGGVNGQNGRSSYGDRLFEQHDQRKPGAGKVVEVPKLFR